MLIIEDTLLLALKQLYDFESPRVAGPHGGNPGFNPWSIADVIENTSIDEPTLNRLIETLQKKNQILAIPEYDNNPKRYFTRTAEMVRTIGTIHEYVNRKTEESIDDDDKQHLQIIEATKWVPALLERPDRVISISEFIENLKDDLELYRISSVRRLSISQVLELTEMAVIAIARHTLESTNVDSFKLTKFQDRAIRMALLKSFSDDVTEKSMIVTAGTGSGKTISFTVPVLVDSVIDTFSTRPLSGARWSQLMIYPRNELAFDQFSTLEAYCGQLNDLMKESSDFSNIQLTIALDADGFIKKEYPEVPYVKNKPIKQWDVKWDKPKPNVVKSSASRYGGVNPHNRSEAYTPANIIVAGSESFRRRLVIPEVCQAIKNSLQRVVFDEIHLAEGLQGGHLRGLFNRLKLIAGNKQLLFIGSSATIASPQKHVEKIWGDWEDNVDLAQPSTSESKGAPGGIANHVLVRPRSGVTKGGPVYNSTTLVGHQTKDNDWFEQRENGSQNQKELEKMICFADSRDFVARWQMILNENESNAHFQRIDASQINSDGKGNAIPLPYAYWFDRPLIQQLGNKGKAICDACTKCEKLPENVNVLKSAIQLFRTKIGGQSKPEKFVMEALKEMGEELEINTLDQCPHMIAGTCWHFAPGFGENPIIDVSGENKPNTAQLEPHLITRPGDSDSKVFKTTLRSRRHTADSRGDSEDGLSEKDFTADGLYLHQSGEAYPHGKPTERGPQIPHDVIIATPTLEVGVDMKNVSNIITHRAMRNIASYRQKAGRAGREKNSVTNVVTILSKRPGDYQFYRNDNQLILETLDEPVPVADKNRMVMKSQAYMAVFDWLAVNSCNIEEIQSGESWKERLTSAVALIHENKSEIISWIYSSFTKVNGVLKKEDATKAVEVFLSHLNLILTGEYDDTEGNRLSIIDQFIVAIEDTTNRYTKIETPKRPGGADLAEIIGELNEKLQPCKALLDMEIINMLNEITQEYATDPQLSEKIRTVMNRLDELYSSSSLEHKNRKNIRGLKSILDDILDQINDPEVYEPDQAQNLAIDICDMNNQSARYYLSWLLSECQTFLDDAPFCYIERVFDNPHDKPINIYIDKDRRTKQNMSQFMRDLIPGAWNHRLSKAGTGHALKSPLGDAGAQLNTINKTRFATLGHKKIQTGPMGSALNIEKIPGQFFDSATMPKVIRMKHDEDSLPIVRPAFVKLELEEGVWSGPRNTPSKVYYDDKSGLVTDMDKPKSNTDKPGMIPETWPCRWTTSKSDNYQPILAYSPSEHKSNPGEAGRHKVSAHPLLANIFDEISYSENIEIKDVVVGINRTRGYSLRYRINGSQYAVFGQVYNTHGIKHKLSQSFIDKIDEISDNWQSRKFDTDFWKFLEHHFERNGFTDDDDRFPLKDLHKILLYALYKNDPKKFPDTLIEVVEFLESTPIDEEIFEEYMSSVRLNVRDHVRESLTPLVFNVYNHKLAQIYQHDSLKTSMKQWLEYTSMNTLGKILVEVGGRYTGVEMEKLSFSINVDDLSITLFDNEQEGNGSCELLKNYYYISIPSNAARKAMRGPSIPSSDFVSTIEQQFVTCEEHIVQRLALSSMNPDFEFPRNLVDHSDECQSLVSRYGAFWKKLKLSNLARASQLKLIAPVLRNSLEIDFPGLSVDELEQALHTCSTGCFVCSGAPRSSAFPLSVADRYTSKAIVEDLVDFGVNTFGYINGRNRGDFDTATGRDEVYPHYQYGNHQEYTKRFKARNRGIEMAFVNRNQHHNDMSPIRLVCIIDFVEDLL